MFNYFTRLPSKTKIIEDENPRKSAPVYNKQHVERFQAQVGRFEAELKSDSPGEQSNYLESLKAGHIKPFNLNKCQKGALRAKLLQFHTDIRPAYFGTWQKKSKLVTGRRPFGQDDEIFDYDVDSEAEWDIGGPGESLKGDDSEEEDGDGIDDYEIDMKTFVPHGYVSDDEEAESDNEEKPKDNKKSCKQIEDDDEIVDDNVQEENCDDDGKSDADSDIKVVHEHYSSKFNNTKFDNTFNSNNKVNQQQPVKRTPKIDIKAIILGITYESQPSISDAKLQFLRTFSGVSCM